MFELFEHKADVGVRGVGTSLNEAFSECAKAMYSVMVELESVDAGKDVSVKVSARNEPELLIAWLNELLFLTARKEMIFSEFEVEIKGNELVGVARGEKIDLEKHGLKTEVKGATLAGLKVLREHGRFSAECIVDV